MKRIVKILSATLLSVIFSFFYSGCGVVQQTQKATNLVNCDFRLVSAENIYLAGINISRVRSISDLGFSDAARVMAAVAGNIFLLSFQLNIEGRNPNASPAGLNKLDWILFIDDIQMTSGTLDKAFTIPPNNGTAMIPIQISLDLKQVLKGKSLDAITNFGFNLAGMGNKPTRIKAKLRPTIMIGGYPLTYPGYITISTEYSGS